MWYDPAIEVHMKKPTLAVMSALLTLGGGLLDAQTLTEAAGVAGRSANSTQGAAAAGKAAAKIFGSVSGALGKAGNPETDTRPPLSSGTVSATPLGKSPTVVPAATTTAAVQTA